MVSLEYDYSGTEHAFVLPVDIRDLCEIAQIYFEEDVRDMTLIVGSPNLEQIITLGNDVADQFDDPLRCGYYDC